MTKKLTALLTLAAAMVVGLMVAPVAAQDQTPVFLGCVCFDSSDRMSRQDARNACDDQLAVSYVGGALHPSTTKDPAFTCELGSCGINVSENPDVSWACNGVGGLID